MTTYTVTDRNGTILSTGCTLEEAANEVMREDGHEFEIREGEYKGERMFELWTSQFSRNSGAYNGLTKSVIFSLESDREKAEAEIYAEVIKHADWWMGCEAMTDEAYAKMQAEIEADNA